LTDFTEKHTLALDELAKTGMKTRYCLPPVHRLLWRLGVKVRPPHYSSFVDIVTGIATLFTLMWGSLVSLVTGATGSDILSVYLLSASLGFFFGVFMGYYYRHGVRKHRLTPWEKLTISSEPTDGNSSN